MKDPVHHHLIIRHFKIKTPFLRPKTVEGLAVPLDFSEAVIVQVLEVVARHLELVEQGQLFEGVQLRDFRRTDFIENDL